RHRWRAGWAAFSHTPQAYTRHAAAPSDDCARHFGAEKDRLPGLAWRAERHRPLHHLQPLATAVHRGSLEIESRPRAMDALHGRPGILLVQTGHAKFQRATADLCRWAGAPRLRNPVARRRGPRRARGDCRRIALVQTHAGRYGTDHSE